MNHHSITSNLDLPIPPDDLQRDLKVVDSDKDQSLLFRFNRNDTFAGVS